MKYIVYFLLIGTGSVHSLVISFHKHDLEEEWLLRSGLLQQKNRSNFVLRNPISFQILNLKVESETVDPLVHLTHPGWLGSHKQLILAAEPYHVTSYALVLYYDSIIGNISEAFRADNIVYIPWANVLRHFVYLVVWSKFKSMFSSRIHVIYM